MLKELEKLKTTAPYKPQANLLSLHLSTLLENLIKDYQAQFPSIANLIFLETLILISQVLYRKSQLILKTYFYFEEEEEKITEEFWDRDKEDQLSLPLSCLSLPMDRILGERVFLPKVDGITFSPERKDFGILLEVLINLMIQKKANLHVLEVSSPGIGSFLTKTVELLRIAKRITFSELLENFSLSRLTLVYLFLTLLFLAFEGKVYLFPQEKDLTIYYREG